MRVDTHIHSNYSGECDPELCRPRLILRSARRAGVDAICISDHDTLDGYVQARSQRRPDDPLVIPACETSSAKGHLLVIGVERCWEKGADPSEIVDDVRAEGGIVSAPHPFYISRISVSWLARDLRLAIETFNAMASILIYPNLVARKFAEKYDLPVTAGSDAHSYEMVGWGTTESDSDSIDGWISDVNRGDVKIRGERPNVGWAVKFASKSAYAMLRSFLESRGFAM